MATAKAARMLPSKPLLSLCLAAVAGAIVALPSRARAAEVSQAEPVPSAAAQRPTVRELSFRAHVGGYDDVEKNSGGFNLGGSALYRHGYFIGGGLVEHGSALFDYQYTAVAPVLGIAMPVPAWARVELLMTAGAHVYDGIGKGFILSNDPGASATVPFAGLRGYAGVPLGGKAFAFTAGVGGWVESDVFRPNVTYTFRESLFTPHDETVTRSVGTSRAGLALLLGGTFGI